MTRGSKKDLVSVIIPVYNSRAFICDTLDSVIRQRDEEGMFDIEIIVVDDGSTDGTADAIADYVNQANADPKTESEAGAGRSPVIVRIVPNRGNKGAACARNTGIDEARGNLIAFIDADDVWLPGKLIRQISYMRDTGAVFSFTGYEFADEDCRGTGRIVRVPGRISYREALKNTTIFTSTVVFDMERLGASDIYFPEVESEDTANWWKVLREHGDAYGLDETLTLYRRSGGTLSSNKLIAIKRIWNLYRRVEGLSLPYSLYCFVCYAFRAVARRV